MKLLKTRAPGEQPGATQLTEALRRLPDVHAFLIGLARQAVLSESDPDDAGPSLERLRGALLLGIRLALTHQTLDLQDLDGELVMHGYLHYAQHSLDEDQARFMAELAGPVWAPNGARPYSGSSATDTTLERNVHP